MLPIRSWLGRVFRSTLVPALGAVAACSSDATTSRETDVTLAPADGDLARDTSISADAGDLAEAGLPPSDKITTYNTSPDSIIVWSQNVGQFGQDQDGFNPQIQKPGSRWKNIIRCIQDPKCNGFGVIPDVFVFQEASNVMCNALDNELEAKLDGGANTWDWMNENNYSSYSKWWRSSCMLFRKARFDAPAESKLITVYESSPPTSTCKLSATKAPNFKLKDKVRAAVSPKHFVSIASVHEDHFGATGDTCDSTTLKPDGSVIQADPTPFCNYLNMKRLGSEMLPADMKIVAGDQNYIPLNCEGKEYLRCEYKAIVAGQGSCGTKANLGWHDPVFDANPQWIKGSGQIDWILTYNASRSELMPRTDRNYKPGHAGQCFYCAEPAGAYGGGPSPGVTDPERITDHTAKFVRVFY